MEHRHASQKDLNRIAYLVARFYKERDQVNGKKHFQSYLEQIKRDSSLLEPEKQRLEQACNLQLNTDYFERSLEPPPTHF